MQTPEPPTRRGRPPGSSRQPNSGAKKRPQTTETAAVVLRCHVFPRRAYPGHAALARATGLSLPTWNRRLAGSGSFTAAQLLAANGLLDACSPAYLCATPAAGESLRPRRPLM